jgi:hypothetical protein
LSATFDQAQSVNADLAVRDSDAWIYRLGHNVTLLGRIVFVAPPVIH